MKKWGNHLRILMLNYEYPPIGGGAANANRYIINEFSKRNDIEIDLITSSPKRFRIEKPSKNIRIFRLDVNKRNVHYWTFLETLKWSVKAIIFTRKIIKKNRYNVCHCWFGWPPGFIGWLYRKHFPYIVALRGSDVPGYNPRLKILDKLILGPISRMVWRKARHVIANSKGLKKLGLKTLNRPIKIIYNGVDTDEFKPKKRQRKKLQLICVARLIRRKGLEYLIRAIAGRKDVHLTIIGDGDLKTELRSLARRQKANVQFLGYIPHDNLPKLYSDSDVFVLPSLNEGMSNTILEAISSGLAIITTDTGGTKELIDGNGIIIRKKSVVDISNAIESLKDYSILTKYKLKSRKMALTMNWQSIADQYHEVYRNCVE